MSDIWFCEKQNSDDFQQKSVGVKPKKELPRDGNGRIKKDGIRKKKKDNKKSIDLGFDWDED